MQFSLANIEIEDFKIYPGVKLPEKPVVGVTLKPTIGVGPIDNNTIACRVIHEYLKDDKKMVSTKIAGVFEISPESWDKLIDKEKNQITIPREFAIYFSSIIIGALRGVLLARLIGTDYSNLTLPLINTTDMFDVDKDIVINFNPPNQLT